MLWAAWQAASLNAYAYHSPKKMPALDTLLDMKPKARAVQTPEQMKAVFDAMRQQMSR